MKNLCCMLCFFSFTVGSGCEPSLEERINAQILHCEYSKQRYCENNISMYYQGKIDAYKNVLTEIKDIQSQ